MSRARKLITGLVGGLLLIQLVPVGRTNPPETAEPPMTPEVREILTRSCYDCHSNRTTWPWYSKVAPVSWWVVHHVNEGREHLNFSTWDRRDAKHRSKAAEEIAEEVKEGGMPLASYVVGHPQAALSDSDKAALAAWAGTLGETGSGRSEKGEGEGEDGDGDGD